MPWKNPLKGHCTADPWHGVMCKGYMMCCMYHGNTTPTSTSPSCLRSVQGNGMLLAHTLRHVEASEDESEQTARPSHAGTAHAAGTIRQRIGNGRPRSRLVPSISRTQSFQAIRPDRTLNLSTIQSMCKRQRLSRKKTNKQKICTHIHTTCLQAAAHLELLLLFPLV